MKILIISVCVAVCVFSFSSKLYVSSANWYDEVAVQKKIIEAGTQCSGANGSVSSVQCRKTIEDIAK